jgi:putative toxin-antitoxin system antitoxin component (TIGR02293 family)
MLITKAQLMNRLKDPIQEIKTIRDGIQVELIEDFLNEQAFVVKDVLGRLQIPKSTYFAKKKKQMLLDSSTTEKFFRLISVIQVATEILGKSETKNWLYRNIASLGEQAPMDLLDTEAGHRLVEQTLLQIKYGVYS